jgi:AraC-like DNA-binding protein
MSRPSTVIAPLAARIAGAAVLRGADGPSLLAAAGLTPAALSDPEGRVPLAALTALFEEGARRTGDDAFGLHAAEIARSRPDNVLAIAVQSSPTLGEAYRRAARYAHILADTLEIRLVDEGDECWLSRHQRHPAGGGRHAVEFSLAVMFLFGRGALGAAFRLRRVCFRHPPPARTDEHTRIFEAPIAFGADRDAIAFARPLLDAPLPTASARVSRHLERLLDELGAASPRRGDRSEEVRAALVEELRSVPTLEGVAARLGVAPRSLQRGLSAEGTSYSGLLDELRHELALAYLRQRDLALAEVAFLLGFAEQSAFQRAFRRWTGTSPAEWRRRER